MDTKKLIQEAKARFKHQEAKVYLQEKYQPRLLLTNQGGMWNVTPNFLSVLRTNPNQEDILMDSFNKPIKVKIADLLSESENLYRVVMNEWYEEFVELQNHR